MIVATLSAKGQIVLPKAIREALRLRKGDRLTLTLEGDHLVLAPLPPPSQRDWRQWRGSLEGTHALEEHLKEHADEVRSERVF